MSAFDQYPDLAGDYRKEFPNSNRESQWGRFYLMLAIIVIIICVIILFSSGTISLTHEKEEESE